MNIVCKLLVYNRFNALNLMWSLHVWRKQQAFTLFMKCEDRGLVRVDISINSVSQSAVCGTAFPTSSSVMPHVILTDGIPWSCAEKCSPLFVLVAFCLYGGVLGA